MAQVRGLGPKVGGRLALFCIHRVNRVYSTLAVTPWTYYSVINCRIIIIIIIVFIRPVTGPISPLVLFVVLLVGATSSEKPIRLRRFKLDRDDICAVGPNFSFLVDKYVLCSIF